MLHSIQASAAPSLPAAPQRPQPVAVARSSDPGLPPLSVPIPDYGFEDFGTWERKVWGSIVDVGASDTKKNILKNPADWADAQVIFFDRRRR